MTPAGLHVVVIGDPAGARVVLVHGSMDRAATFARTARHLDDLHVVRYDRRGYGRSGDGRAAVGLDGHVDDLLAVLDEVPAVVAGHSLGGVIALAAADRRPDLVPAVAAWESPMSWRSWWPRGSAGGAAVGAAGDGGDPAAAAELFMVRMVGAERWAALPERTRRERRSEGRALVAELTALRREAPYEPGRLVVPVVAGHGTRSDAHHIRGARTLVDECPGAELVVIDGAGHGAHLTHPAAFADFVRRAVARS